MEFIPGCPEAQVASGLYCPSGVGTAYMLESLASGVWCLLQVEGLKEATLPIATLLCVIFETGSHFLYQAGLEIFESTLGFKKKKNHLFSDRAGEGVSQTVSQASLELTVAQASLGDTRLFHS